jgi:thiamine biosynthesis protein ThiS
MLKLLINGEIYMINSNDLTLYQLKEYLFNNSKQTQIISELNYRIVDDNDNETFLLNNYDKLEFIRIVGGG